MSHVYCVATSRKWSNLIDKTKWINPFWVVNGSLTIKTYWDWMTSCGPEKLGQLWISLQLVTWLAPDYCQTNNDLLSRIHGSKPLWRCDENTVIIYEKSCSKCSLRDGRRFCPGLNVLTHWRRRRDGRRFEDDISLSIFLNEKVWISIKMSLNFVPGGPANNIPALARMMAWRRQDNKPLSEPMMVNLLTHICVTWPQWVK